MMQEGGEGPETTFWILAFAQNMWRPTVLTAVSNVPRKDSQ